ncbi:MAG: hypothetical protein V7L02_13040, partial [Nostoc sp.]|uniref:hypothetical protein n=1 Tax=Nostoc sp. TaxID=1180 RepID=UPI002FF90258
TSGCSHVYCLVVWRSVRRSRTIACDSCVSPDLEGRTNLDNSEAIAEYPGFLGKGKLNLCPPFLKGYFVIL